jgi:hypothetical protein
MISAVVAMIIAGLACSTFFFEDALATELRLAFLY